MFSSELLPKSMFVLHLNFESFTPYMNYSAALQDGQHWRQLWPGIMLARNIALFPMLRRFACTLLIRQVDLQVFLVLATCAKGHSCHCPCGPSGPDQLSQRFLMSQTVVLEVPPVPTSCPRGLSWPVFLYVLPVLASFQTYISYSGQLSQRLLLSWPFFLQVLPFTANSPLSPSCLGQLS